MIPPLEYGGAYTAFSSTEYERNATVISKVGAIDGTAGFL